MILPKKMNFSILPTRRPADEVYYMKDKPSQIHEKANNAVKEREERRKLSSLSLDRKKKEED